MVDFDNSYFHDRTAAKLEALQDMLGKANYVLWASSGGRAAQPSSNMMVGLARTLQHEIPNLSFQTLDVDDTDKPMTTFQTAGHLVTTTTRLISSSSAALMENVLWSKEPELLIKNGKLWIPRVNAVPKLDNRLNSARRKVVSQVDLDCIQTVIYQEENTRQWNIRSENEISKLAVPEKHVMIRVKFSSISPIRILAESFLYVSIGEEFRTKRPVIALSLSNASTIVVPVAWTTVCEASDDEAPNHLWAFVCGLIGRSVIEASPVSAISLVHQPDEFLKVFLSFQADQAVMNIRFTRLQSSPDVMDGSIVVHPFASTRHIRSVLPHNASSVFDMSNSAETFAAMAKCAPLFFLESKFLDAWS